MKYESEIRGWINYYSAENDGAWRIRAIVLALVLALALLAPGYKKEAYAATYNAACTGGIGNASDLIAKINMANANPGGNTINLGNGCIYTLSAVDNYWYGPNGLPPITSVLTIKGNGATIECDTVAQPDRLRFFYIGAATLPAPFVTPGAGELTLRNLTLRGGQQKGNDGSGGGAGMGGAIFNQGALTIDSVTFFDNAAIGGNGGVAGVGGNAGCDFESSLGSKGGKGTARNCNNGAKEATLLEARAVPAVQGETVVIVAVGRVAREV